MYVIRLVVFCTRANIGIGKRSLERNTSPEGTHMLVLARKSIDVIVLYTHTHIFSLIHSIISINLPIRSVVSVVSVNLPIHSVVSVSVNPPSFHRFRFPSTYLIPTSYFNWTCAMTIV